MEMETEGPSTGLVLFREIYKNGWLRRTDRSEKEQHRFWVVFCVHDDTEPRLEGYAEQKQAATHSPVWGYSLRNTLHLSPTLCATARQDYEFCVNGSDNAVLRLAAPTYQGMYDWVQLVTRKLTEMKILGPKENVYSKGPERSATRDPTSPLPPPPRPPLQIPTIPVPPITPVRSQSPSQPRATGSGTLVLVNQPAGDSITIQVPGPDRVPNVFTFDDIPDDNPAPRQQRPVVTGRPTRNILNSSGSENNNSSYDSVFLASSYSPAGEIVRAQIDNGGETSDSRSHYAALIEYRSLGSTHSRSQTEPVGSAREASPNTPCRQLTLREQQVLQLRREMSHPAGVRLQLRRRDCKDNIALVDTYGAVWVAGWKQREHPMLYNALHIGDQVLSLAGIAPQSAAAARDILKSCTSPYVEVIVRRLPQGRAMTLMRRAEGESLGLEVNGNEVTGVGGVALTLGLSPLAPATDPSVPIDALVTWTLTEVNGRPLNLFWSGVEARERLGAVGRDLSVVVQPTDFVSSLKKRLRALRGYKHYVVQ